MEKRALGYALIILGVVVIFLKPITGITGMVISSEALSLLSDAWFLFIGIVMIFAGIIISYSSKEERIIEASQRYGAAESKLKKILGSKFYDIKPDERTSYVKSYRRHLDRVGDTEEEISTGETTEAGYSIIRTKKFNRAVKKHDPDLIQRAIDKIGTGLGKEEPLTGREDWSIRTTGGGRIIFDKDEGKKTVKLKNYTSSHKYDRV